MGIVGGVNEQNEYGEPYASGDLITLQMNLEENYVQFSKNHQKFNKLSLKNLTTKNFHLAVWMNYTDDKVTIIEDKDL